MSRIIRWALACALMSVAVAPAAQAKRFHVTGQQTTITPSSQVTQFLTAHHVTVTAIAPATVSGGTWTLPIKGGRVVAPRMNGVLRHDGGLQLSAGKVTVTLDHLVLARAGKHAALWARVNGHRLRVAKIADPTVSRSGKTGTLSGELTLTGRAAHKLNRLLGKHAVSRGADLGSLTSTVTVA